MLLLHGAVVFYSPVVVAATASPAHAGEALRIPGLRSLALAGGRIPGIGVVAAAITKEGHNENVCILDRYGV